MDRDNLYQPDAPLDDELQKELDAALGDMSLEDLVDLESGKTPKAKSNDRVIEGRVVGLHGDDIFVDIGGRSEGVLSATTYTDADDLPNEGDTIKVQVEGYDRDGTLRLAREGAVRAAAWDTLERGQVVEGIVTGVNSGGLELKVNSLRAFMPISQIDLSHTEDASIYLNQKLAAEVTEVDERSKKFVISRRKLLISQREAQAEEFWPSVHEGKVLLGTVRSIKPYGAFVDVGGADGLLHIRDMSWTRVEKPEDIVHVGQQLEVQILSVDLEAKKIGLGIKQTQGDPWMNVESNYPIGTSVDVKVVKLMDFGAFAEIEPGVEGLIPVSEISFRHIGHPKEELAAGQSVRVKVIRIEPDKKRIALSIKQAGDDPWIGAESRFAVGSAVEGTVTRLADFGAFVELAPGVEGLIHISQLADRRVETARSVVSEGQTVNPRVVSVDEGSRRIGLSLKSEPDTSAQEAEGSLADADAVQKRLNEAQSDKKLKGGLEGGSAMTKFGEIKLG
ncbi:MAG: S1 RNA-binding domain-containing protein [Phycisphaerales bacterium]|jgi:small subunit ribosomal protein S1|nr:S1 RNA-binding domain-containing protein [Phycisphaerales bacterium]